ncbi:DUF4350 domain-containing protein [Erythrobacter sp. HL-111]|uniref:DUF4350 domain-containing protein n=1 Tax=Erythrobacter sp. HL-111 TaxID=1798193 RepID=UPI0006DACDDD|nr:DUF4350 domain-containing protein [Erythrobacter sp. HL-111]KPP89454.1 MAG: protein of unknown function containing DUF4350 domain [Erythrobacteraceae bacterium HL-111]SDS49058.1 hypothetical protein SAMN04515621_1663 [Erythrobacter sp. HL-111]
MNAAATGAPDGTGRNAAPFGKGTVFAVLVAGFLAFLALLWFLSAGDTGERESDGAAHAVSVGLNGYAGLVRLLEAEGHEVEVSRSPGELETGDLLVIAPSPYADPEEIGALLEARQYRGPTLLVLPKWQANTVPDRAPREIRERFREGWVALGTAFETAWTDDLPAPYAFETEIEQLEEDESPGWDGFGLEGELPTRTIRFAKEQDTLEPLVTDAAGHVLAFNVLGEEGSDFYDNAHFTVVVAEPDLVNNWGLADPARAAAALELVRETGYGEDTRVVFDLTLNGFSGAQNLLTLAFRPPFLAATLCLVLALVIVGWRAFMRFGAVAAGAPETGFGKARLVRNGAGLIVRAKRMRLLAAPYAALAQRRIARLLGVKRAQEAAIDAALAARLPDETPFSTRAKALRSAEAPDDILRAAKALDELARKLTR